MVNLNKRLEAAINLKFLKKYNYYFKSSYNN